MTLVDPATGEIRQSRYQVMPPLTAEEFADLREDIAVNGVLQPILIDEHNRVIDGHNRKMIAESLGVTCPVIKCPPNLTDRQKRTLARGVNLHRRHLSREQRREIIADALRDAPELSDRQHAADIGVDHKTVGSVRDELEGRGEIPHVSERTDSVGRQQPATKPPVVTTTERESHSTTTSRPLPPSGDATGDVASPSPVAPSPDNARRAGQLDALIESDPDYQLASWRASFGRAVSRLNEVTLYPPEDVALKAESDELDVLADLITSINRWHDRVRAQRTSGLRLMKGGRG